MVDGVVAESRLDFEDSGLDETTLQELKQIWQERLSGFGIAKMPWDPEPVESVPLIDSYGNGTAALGDVSIKREEIYDPSSAAAMRAAAHIQKMAQENKTVMPGIDQSVRGIMSKVEQTTTPGQQQQQQQQQGLPNSQSSSGDLLLPGSNPTASDVAIKDEPSQREEADKILLQKMTSSINSNSNNSNNNINNNDNDGTDRSVTQSTNAKLEMNLSTDHSKKVSRTNGAIDGDSEEINSDLDDSEDELNSGAEDEDDEGGMIMLCLYDKVQRVKNKWKYILKDGVANINGKDYVFSKGSGESEW